MKTIKQILESHNIKEDTLYHNHSYVYSDIYDAMLEFGKRSYTKGFCNGADYEAHRMKYVDVNEYLINIEND